MICTLAEAETKSCPHVYGDNGWHCIGSHCMAWRWQADALPGGEKESPFRPGYCGLAGKPDFK